MRPNASSIAIGTLLLVLATPAAAQHEQHEEHVSAYAGEEKSEIPSLTALEMENLRTAAGMGLARAAELNHFPGPKHVLEMADELALTGDQAERVTRIRERMATDAVELGDAIIEAERTLNLRFRHGHIDEAALQDLLEEISDLSGRLRFVHLRAHLETTGVLATEQVVEYDRLRGYLAEPNR